MDYNGGALIGMKGKNCVAIATDKRFGIQAQTVSLDFTVSFICFCLLSILGMRSLVTKKKMFKHNMVTTFTKWFLNVLFLFTQSNFSILEKKIMSFTVILLVINKLSNIRF